MILQAGEIYLKKDLSEDNYPLLLTWLTDLETVGYLYAAKRMVEFKTIEDVKEFLAEEDDEVFWGIYIKDGVFIGYTSLCSFHGKDQCEFNIFILDKKYWGKGIGLKVTTLMLDYAFTVLGMKTIVLETSEFNTNALKLYERVGFQRVKVIPNDRMSWHDGKWILNGSMIMEKKGQGK
jgi:RimJ/RimL family protein N-acetyltransferase